MLGFWCRRTREVDAIRYAHPGVILHLRDALVPATTAPGTTSELIAFARVPARSAGGRLVLTAGTQRHADGVVESAVHTAMFVPRTGQQLHTPRREAEAWSRAVFGELLDPYLHRSLGPQQWPWPDQLTSPVEKFVVLHHPDHGPIPATFSAGSLERHR